MKFLIISSKNSIKKDCLSILDLLSMMVDVFEYEITSDNNLTIYFDDSNNIDFNDFILTINQDFYNDYRGYISKNYDKDIKLVNKIIIERIENIPIDDKHIYLDDKEVLKYLVSSNRITEIVKKEVLGKYYNNQEMLNTIKVYLDNNQNTSLTAKKLYLHRNTLIFRIEKFNEETKLDIRNFIDGYLVYHLL